MMTATLIIGGVKSGKSSYGESLLLNTLSQVNLQYIASSVPMGEELCGRIERHKKQRDSRFNTCEVAYKGANNSALSGSDLCDLLARYSQRKGQGILIECMATWLAGMLTFSDDLEQALADYYIEKKQLVELLTTASANVVIISNEVGMGLIGATKVERCFADEMGLLNQSLGTICEQVIQVSAGFPQYLKGRGC